MSEPHVRSFGTVDQIQDNMLAYFRLFAGLPGITVVDEDVFWLVSAWGEPGSQILGARLSSATAESRIDAIFDQISQYTDQIDWMVFRLGWEPVFSANRCGLTTGQWGGGRRRG
jgi:hypothetical protein